MVQRISRHVCFTTLVRRCAPALLAPALLAAAVAGAEPVPTPDPFLLDMVAVSIVDGGRALLLATPALPNHDRHWRIRSFDTSALPQPIIDAMLSASGTKLLLVTAAGPGILDLTRQRRHNASRQFVDVTDLATDGDARPHSHRLPAQRFIVAFSDGARVLDDVGAVLGEYPSVDAARRAEPRASRPVSGTALETTGLAAEGRRAVATATAEPLTWTFFRVTADEQLYAPVLEFARLERVFPSAFETLETLIATARGKRPAVVDSAEALADEYFRQGLDARRQQCVMYYRTRSAPGAWSIEYWFYYPFDSGGFHAHLHDPEHLFVEVDKLGGAVRRVVGSGHGHFASNNIYSAIRPGALPVDLPLFAVVELGKHASAPDLDRDGLFTPGLDENVYSERAKIWGVRDRFGTINNQLLGYERTMSAPRRPEDWLGPLASAERYPHEPDVVSHACCRLLPLPAETAGLSRCHEATTDCARRFITSHEDFIDPRSIDKAWFFPPSFVRATYGTGPRVNLHSAGLGYSADLDRLPALGRALPLPGRVGGEVFAWWQDVNAPDPDSCLADCERSAGVGWGVRYEQFLSNLFGLFSSVRSYSPPIGDVWISFGPLVEIPVRNAWNATVHMGVAFRPFASPRFDFKLSLGLWAPHRVYLGIPAGADDDTR